MIHLNEIRTTFSPINKKLAKLLPFWIHSKTIKHDKQILLKQLFHQIKEGYRISTKIDVLRKCYRNQ